MLLAGWEVRIVKNSDRGLESFLLAASWIAGIVEFRPLTSGEKDKTMECTLEMVAGSVSLCSKTFFT